MKRIWILILCLTLLIPLSGFAKAPEVATYPPAALGAQYGVFFTGPGREPEAVSASHPMPVTVVGSFTSSGGPGGASQILATDTMNRLRAIIENIASDSEGNVFIHIASSDITLSTSTASDSAGRMLVNIGSNTTIMIASISQGIVFQDKRSIASDSNTVLADITSGTAAPFWLMIRNTGTQKIHVDSVAPDDACDYIGAGEQYGPFFYGSNVVNEKFRANSAGTSTWALTIRK